MMTALPPRRTPRHRLNNHINITPFVDVMLVLLVVFMLTAPLLSLGVSLELPKTEAASLNDNKEPLVVSIDEEGSLYISETEVAEGNLVARLVAISGANQELEIYVRGDANLPYGQVMRVMGKISAAGFTKVVLLAQAPE